MTNSSQLISVIINSVNQDVDLSALCLAVRAFEKTNLPVPLKKTHLALSCIKNSVSIENGSTINDLTVKIACYTPLTKAAYSGNNLMENIFQYLEDIFPETVTSYGYKETVYDKDVRAYRLISEVNFRYNLTP